MFSQRQLYKNPHNSTLWAHLYYIPTEGREVRPFVQDHITESEFKFKLVWLLMHAISIMLVS